MNNEEAVLRLIEAGSKVDILVLCTVAQCCIQKGLEALTDVLNHTDRNWPLDLGFEELEGAIFLHIVAFSLNLDAVIMFMLIQQGKTTRDRRLLTSFRRSGYSRLKLMRR